MGKQLGWRYWIGFLPALLVAGCDQELVLPDGARAAEDAGGAPSDGITGAQGGGGTAVAVDRLRLPDEPLYTDFGGDGGDSAGGAGGDGPVGGSGGAAGRGGMLGPSGGAFAGGSGSAGASSGAPPPEAPSAPPRLFFSEYLEGTGSLKALEIYAVESASLEGCYLHTYFNGKLEPARLALHGRIAAGEVYVLCSSALAARLPEACQRSTNLTFNGDDALALVCGDVTLDVFGQVGVDPGEAWGDGATLDHTLRRSCAVSTGRSDGSQPFDPAVEWSALGPDLFDDLGKHDCAETAPSE